jgi:hypothetical protein
MTKEVISVWNVSDLATMRDAIADALETAKMLGHDPSTVYPDKLRLALVQETLTDGSHVLNLYFHDGGRELLRAPTLSRG